MQTTLQTGQLILPRSKYKCSFVFYNTSTNIVYGPDNGDISIGLLHINLGCNSNFLFKNGLFSNSNIIGILTWKTLDDNTGKGYLYSDINNNVPFFFNNGILNNFINIKITEWDMETLWEDTNGEVPYNYMLCLTFELME